MEWQIQQCLIGAMTKWNENSARKGETVGYSVPGTVVLQGTAWLVQGSLLSLWLTAAVVWHFCSFVTSFCKETFFVKTKRPLAIIDSFALKDEEEKTPSGWKTVKHSCCTWRSWFFCSWRTSHCWQSESSYNTMLWFVSICWKQSKMEPEENIGRCAYQ